MLSPQQLKAMKLAKSAKEPVVTGNQIAVADPNAVIDSGVQNSAVQALPYLTIGRGSQAVKVPTTDVIRHLQDPNSLVKTTRKDWDFKNLANLQAQLDYDDRVDGSGVQMLKYLASRTEAPKGKKTLPLNPQVLASITK